MITRDPIEIEAVTSEAHRPDAGAVVTFAGVVRENGEAGRVNHILYECYESMAHKEIARIIARYQSTVRDIRVVHRVGKVPAGEASLLVMVRAEHRRQAFDVCQHVIDDVKRHVPIWKQEHYVAAAPKWIDNCSGCAHP